MKGDISRHTFRSQNQFSGVRQQQGRVQLDADWNEQVDIQSHLDQITRRDVIGSCCVPAAEPNSFQVVELRGGVTTKLATDLGISPGRIYVDGRLCELEASYLDGTTFGSPASGGRTEINLRSGDGRPGGDFELWFWLVPEKQ